MVEAIVKAGRMLATMDRPRGRGGDRRSTIAATVDNLSDLGFTDPRARRWQIAAQLPDAERAANVTPRYVRSRRARQEAGERHSGRGDQKAELHGVTPLPTLPDLDLSAPAPLAYSKPIA